MSVSALKMKLFLDEKDIGMETSTNLNHKAIVQDHNRMHSEHAYNIAGILTLERTDVSCLKR